MDPAVRCPMCAEEIGVDATVCPFCRTRLAITFEGYCSACHAVVEADPTGLCRRCGAPVADLRAQGRPAEEAGAPVVPPAPPMAARGAPVPPAPEPAPPKAWWDRGRAAPRPAPAPRRRGSWVVALGVVLVTILVLGVGIGLVFLATGGAEMLKPVVAVTFDTIGQYPEERRVTLDGRLRLPSRLQCDDDCGVYLVDPGNPESEIPLFIDVAEYSRTAAPNQMERLSYLYKTEDFRVHLDDGSWVGDGALVRVTGSVCRTVEKKDVCLHAHQIERTGG